METYKSLTRNQYQTNPGLFFIGLFIVTLITQMLSGTTFLMLLSRPRAIVIGLIMAFSIIAFVSYKLSLIFLEKWDLEIPTIMLWLYPLMTLGISYLLLLGLLVVVPASTSRSIWSELAQLNAKTTTIMFTITIIGFKIYIALSFVVALGRYISFWFGLFREPEKIRERLAGFDEAKVRGATFNRYCLFSILILLFFLGGWVLHFRPETVLYYRAEIQLKTGLNPEVALETLHHLARKYPDYKYLDTVEFRSAWILERRMGKHAEAIAAYEAFFKKYGMQNVWVDEAIVNIVQVCLDKLKNPGEALKWIKTYREHFPAGQMLAHLALYEVRALIQENRRPEAKTALETSLEKFRGHHLIIYDTEDDFVTTLPFEITASAIDI